MNDQPKTPSPRNKGVKKNAGHYRDAVIAEERDEQQRHPEARPDSPSKEKGVGERVSDGRRETYTGNTASELKRDVKED